MYLTQSQWHRLRNMTSIQSNGLSPDPLTAQGRQCWRQGSSMDPPLPLISSFAGFGTDQSQSNPFSPYYYLDRSIKVWTSSRHTAPAEDFPALGLLQMILPRRSVSFFSWRVSYRKSARWKISGWDGLCQQNFQSTDNNAYPSTLICQTARIFATAIACRKV